MKNSILRSATIGLKLLLICAVVAGVVAFVYGLTAETYAKNLNEVKNNDIREIFCTETAVAEKLNDAVYEVKEGETQTGYCVELTTKGYGGDINMMVGFRADGTILGVSIVSHSETPGLGAKITEPSFLKQFADKTGDITLDDIDAISGATYSSRYVTDGIRQASDLLKQALAGEEGGN